MFTACIIFLQKTIGGKVAKSAASDDKIPFFDKLSFFSNPVLSHP